MQDNESTKDFDLTCWYLNLRRVIELTGAYELSGANKFGSLSQIEDDQLRKLGVIAQAKDALVTWARNTKPPTLGQLILSNKVSPGTIFTHYSNFYCRGLKNYSGTNNKKILSAPLPEIYSKLNDLSPGTKLRFKYHPEHLVSHSAWHTLSGQRQLFVLGVVDAVSNGVIDAFPYVIATLVDFTDRPSIKQAYWTSRLEVFVDVIDSFGLVRNQKTPAKGELELLKNVSEVKVKEAFAEIIGEPTVPKDWGGEQSDMFSSYVILNGKGFQRLLLSRGKLNLSP